MKKLFFLSLMAVFFTACSEDHDVEETKFFVLTFEDADYISYPSVANYWSNLIDNPQYGGPLLNGDDYYWFDLGNTNLQSSGFSGEYKYASGGHAVSNYVDTDLTHGDYNHQLAVPIKDSKTGFGGHNGSKNFCVHYGAVANVTDLGNTNLPSLLFNSGITHVIDHMYVAPTTYLLNVEENGNEYASALGQDGWLKIVAYGLSEDLIHQTGKCEFYLYKDGQAVKNWTKWDLSSLGRVHAVAFNMEGSDVGAYGLNTPAYFAYDDVTVRND